MREGKLYADISDDTDCIERGTPAAVFVAGI